ncbi:MAG: TonB-dependent receptor [Acidobacteriia bacterium]|nr:TonB-dependent receptor [Terriglobia bacterium]
MDLPNREAAVNVRSFVVALFVALLLAGSLMAQQETGRIVGTVKDQSGAVVPGAAVTIKNIATSAVRTTVTAGDGTYVATNLLPGTYSVTVALTGFNTISRQLTLAVGSVATTDFTLTVGATPTTVVVSEAAVQVDTETQTLSNVITTKQILQLPTLTRDPYDLVAIAGNITPIDPRDVANGSFRGVGFNINGQRDASTNILLDGADNNDTFLATVGQRVPLDSVQEFSVVSSAFTAEYGRASGGVVNVVTKTGTNEFHGSAYEFNRVSKLSSNGFDNNAKGIPRPVFDRNQFGFSVGGPVLKDKLFFFNSTEWMRVRSGSTSTALVPTPELLAAAAPQTQLFFQTLGALKVQPNGRIYTKNDLPGLCGPSGPCAALAGTTPVWATVNYPVPTDAGGGFPQNQYQTVSRVDYNLSSKTTLYGRYALQSIDFFNGFQSFSPYQGYDTGETDFNQNALFSVTHTFTPQLVSQSKVVYNRLTSLDPLSTAPVSPTLFLASGSVASKINGIDVALPGYLPFTPGSGIPFGGPQNLGQVYEDVGWTKGVHTFRFGGQYIYIRDNRAFGAYQEPVEQLGTNLSQGMDNLLTGQLFRFSAAIDPQGKFPGQTVSLPVGTPDFTRSNRYHDFALYAQDSWRVVPRFTANFGVRWEYFGVQHNKDPFKDSNFYFGSGSSIDQQVANGSVQLAPNSPTGGLWKKDLDNFAPRVGAAWDVFGNGKTSLRGGYGISYERNFGNVTFNVIQNPPNYAVLQLSTVDVGGSLPVTLSNAGPLSGSTGSKVLPLVSLRAVDPNMETAYAHFWDVSLEHEIVRGTVVSLEYTGSKGHGLYAVNPLNMQGSGAVFLGMSDPLARENPQYGNINFRTDNGFSNYDGMILGVRSGDLFKQGLQISGSWTWSHSLDNLSSTFSELINDFNLGLTDSKNPALDYGNSDFDIRHRVSISAVWDLPYGKSLKGVSSQVLRGWSFAPIFTAHTGAPFSIFDGSNVNNIYNRMILVNPISLTGSSNPAPVAGIPNNFTFLDLSSEAAGVGSYANPITGNSDFGPYPANMSGRNIFRQPGAWDFNLGAYKNFKLPKEGTSLQFRAEMYNVFNHSNLYADITSVDISSNSYVPALKGLTGTAAERRNIQFALKFVF